MMARFSRYNPEDDSHELNPTSFHQNRHSTFSSNRLSLPANQNAFGDDSDSDDDQRRNNQESSSEQDFDVYKDFNNQGVRYQSLLNDKNDDESNDNLRENSSPDINQSYLPVDKSTSSALNPYFSEPQSKSNSKLKAQNLNKSNDRESKPQTWKKRWRFGVVVAFITLVMLGVAIYFLYPRQPFISYEVPISLSKSNNTNLVFSARNPTNFSFNAQLDIALDGRSSYLPLHLSSLVVVINDIGSTTNSVVIGKGNLGHSITLKPSGLTRLNFDIHFQYITPTFSDALWQNWRKACGNIAESTANGTITRPALQLQVTIAFDVLGMIGNKSDSAPLNGVSCPVELPAGAPSF
ncbi:hypothetical protein O181_039586 [Austropuccinia psidii MF-1]|uniref:Uncharacterized protein n=1 Tax=Austropuccinia psidii MF-1 TaxID=1389203 RepID=A0A9Q3HCN3_9BASI|nr:hypothetical protein [Austropuccinia psidii MF-1]